MSVDTYLKGKNLKVYRKVLQDDLTILVAPKLQSYVQMLEISTQKKLFGQKIVVLAHHEHRASC